MQTSYEDQCKWIQMQVEKHELKTAVKERAIVILAKRDCCRITVIKNLLRGRGVYPHQIEVDEKDESRVITDLQEIILAGEGKTVAVEFPVVFIGGKLLGGVGKVLSTHIAGELIPMLKDAGALWL